MSLVSNDGSEVVRGKSIDALAAASQSRNRGNNDITLGFVCVAISLFYLYAERGISLLNLVSSLVQQFFSMSKHEHGVARDVGEHHSLAGTRR